jgi:large subunit ribosomal protein L22
MSAFKVREVLDLIRGQEVVRAAEILHFCDRGAAPVVSKLLASAVANASENDDRDEISELYVSECYADEGPTAKRWRPRARGRAARIRKRTCHVTVIVDLLPPDRLEQVRARLAKEAANRRTRRAALGRRNRPAETTAPSDGEDKARPVTTVEPESTKELATAGEVGSDLVPEPTEVANDQENTSEDGTAVEPTGEGGE